MSRIELFGFAFSLALVAAPVQVFSAERDEERGPELEDASASQPVNGAEVSVDLEGSAPGVTPEVFQTALSDHGEWYESGRYGRVWRPRVAVGWRPYYYGSWQWTDEGWYWDSNEPFAWAVYHYGRWVFDPSWGWVWVPGYQWAPAWVTWRFGGDVIGWAPLGPGVSVFVTAYPFVDFWWTFVPTVRFVGVPVHTIAYGPRETHRWFRGTQPAPPRTGATPRDGRLGASPAWGGPPRRVIEERTGRILTPSRRAPTRELGGSRMELRERALPSHLPAPRSGEERPAARPAPSWQEERPSVRPTPRGGEERPSVRPTPRGGEERPSVRPTPRGGEERSSMRRAPRAQEERPRVRAPSHERGERTRPGRRDDR